MIEKRKQLANTIALYQFLLSLENDQTFDSFRKAAIHMAGLGINPAEILRVLAGSIQ